MVVVLCSIFWHLAIVDRGVGKKRIDNLLLPFSVSQGCGERFPNKIPKRDPHFPSSFHGPSLQLRRQHDGGSMHELSPRIHNRTAITWGQCRNQWIGRHYLLRVPYPPEIF